jgi:light-harvesting complex I chlorophyll a/b binding protein 1/light-harvesting complex I chlorophyll a/b binding protein 4
MIVLLIFCGVCEIAGFAAIQQTLEGKRAPGDFALTGNIQVTDSIKKAEIKHSRLAMMAFSGIATQSAITHGAIGFPYF